MQKREQAALAYCQDETSPINALATGSDPADMLKPTDYIGVFAPPSKKEFS
jgi:hypothetical protein